MYVSDRHLVSQDSGQRLTHNNRLPHCDIDRLQLRERFPQLQTAERGGDLGGGSGFVEKNAPNIWVWTNTLSIILMKICSGKALTDECQFGKY